MIRSIHKLGLAIAGVGAMVMPSIASAREHDFRERYHRDREDRVDVRINLNFDRGDFHFGYRSPPPADCGPAYQDRVERVWVEPVYRTVCDRVWVEPVVQDVCDRVWVEAVYEDRRVVRYEGRRRVVCNERVLVSPAHYEERHRQVVIREGHWENVERQVLVSAGHWEERVVRVRVG